MTRALTPPAPVSLADFDKLFESVKNWGRWGPDDDRGTLNYITADKVAAVVGDQTGDGRGGAVADIVEVGDRHRRQEKPPLQLVDPGFRCPAQGFRSASSSFPSRLRIRHGCPRWYSSGIDLSAP